ncbi:hypothetical protein ACFYZ5_46390 [Streptomyces chartreusis]|uniref:hypothetical protein n=1 Tax=Streptomyces chartreusis TaxID=1969 RepID=UPI0036C817B0
MQSAAALLRIDDGPDLHANMLAGFAKDISDLAPVVVDRLPARRPMSDRTVSLKSCRP